MPLTHLLQFDYCKLKSCFSASALFPRKHTVLPYTLTIGQLQTLCRWYKQEQCHREDLSQPTGKAELKEVVLQPLAVFLWRSIRVGWMPHVKWLKMVNLFSLSLCIIVPCFRNRAAKLRRFLHMTYSLFFCRPVFYVYLWIILEVSMIFTLGLFLLFLRCLIALQRYNEKWEPILLVLIFPWLWPENCIFGFISRKNRTYI